MKNICGSDFKMRNVVEESPSSFNPACLGGWEWACDLEGHYIFCDEAVAESIGYSVEYLINLPLTTGIKDRGSQVAIETALRRRQFPFTVQVKMTTLGGKEIEIVCQFLEEKEIMLNGKYRTTVINGFSCQSVHLSEENTNEGIELNSSDPLLSPSEGVTENNDMGLSSEKVFHEGKSNRFELPSSKVIGKNISDKTNSLGVGKKEKSSKFLWLALPLIIFLFFGGALFIERMGLSYNTIDTSLDFLEPSTYSPTANVNPLEDIRHSLVLYDPSDEITRDHYQTVQTALADMRVNYHAMDVRDVKRFQDLDFNLYDTIVIAVVDLNVIERSIEDLFDYINNGGRILFSIRPDPSYTFEAINRKIGIQSYTGNLIEAHGVDFVTDFMPLMKGMQIGQGFLHHSSIPVRLESNAVLHVVSADDFRVPILWEYSYGMGRIVFINSNQFNDKSNRGFLAMAYSLLEDIFVYPVVNSSVTLLEGFPGPLPEQKNENIAQQYGRDIPSFFINVWWPDLQSLGYKYGLKYTGLLIEAYNEQIKPPFGIEGDIEQFGYLGNSILQSEGEIGVSGYNQIPLCLEDEMVSDEPVAWNDSAGMMQAFSDVLELTKSLFPEQQTTTFAPPGGVICGHAWSKINEGVSGLKVVTGTYLPETPQRINLDEFIELPEGMISFPWVSSGYALDEYQQWVVANTLSLYYLNSHVIFPNEILTDDGWGDKGWAGRRQQLEDQFLWVYLNSPGLRRLTAREGAMAVQRYRRLIVDYSLGENQLDIVMENYIDDGWLMMRTIHNPASINGGTYQQVGSDLFLIHAEEAELAVYFEE